jgi:hypothetical protein
MFALSKFLDLQKGLTSRVFLASVFCVNVAMADSADTFVDRVLNDAEAYVLLGVPNANHQSGAIGTSGNPVTDGTMNCCKNSYFGTFKVGIQEKIVNDTLVAEVFHLNEGHLADDKPNSSANGLSSNHRDGFGFALGARWAVNDRNMLQFNIGPYFAMNTVTVQGTQYDRKEHGYLIAAIYEYDTKFHGLKLRTEIDHTLMHGTYNGQKTFDGTTLQFGIAKSIGRMSRPDEGQLPDNQLVVLYGSTKTNSTDGGFADDFQVKWIDKIDPNRYRGLTRSISGLSEGNTRATNRVGIAYQLGYEIISESLWRDGVELGPYLTRDKLSGTKAVNALITLFIEKHFRNHVFLRAQFERVVSTEGPAKDADHFMYGVGLDF